MNPKPENPLKIAQLICVLLIPVTLGCGVLGQLDSPTPTPPLTESQTPIITSTSPPTVTPTATVIPTVCGAPPVMFILLIGSDARQDTYNTGLADAVRIVRVDFVEPVGIRLLPFPRDLYVEIPAIASNSGITHGKLNQAYLYGNPGYGYYEGEGQGPGLLARTLEYNFGARVDHYAAVNLQTFVKIVDALGGINVDLPYRIDGRVPKSKDFNLVFPAGNQHLNGYRTMLLARLRTQGDARRIEIQNLILKALAVKAFQPVTILRLPGLIEAFHGSVQTDLEAGAIAQLVCLTSVIDSKQIEFDAFPEALFTVGRVQDPVLGNTSILSADTALMHQYVQNFNNGAPLVIEEGEGISP